MCNLDFDLKAYLGRIGYEGDPAVSLQSLRKLLHHQLHTIPFENFDICLGRSIDLSPDYQFDKLVRKRRGGYCFEINGLLLAAAQAIGFEARPLLARVHGDDFVGGRDHQLTLITLGHQQWIVDAGFGRDTPHCPLPVNLDETFVCATRKLRFVDGAHLGTLLQLEAEGEWKTLYSFDFEYVGPADIETSNHFTATHPSSHFVQRRVAALPVEGGVVTLSDYKMTIRKDGQQTEEILPDNDDYLNLLEAHFGIVLDARYEDLKPLSVG